MSTPSTFELALELINSMDAFNIERCAELLHDDFVQEIVPKSLSEFIPLRRNKTEVIDHLAELKMAIPVMNVRTSFPLTSMQYILTGFCLPDQDSRCL